MEATGVYWRTVWHVLEGRCELTGDFDAFSVTFSPDRCWFAIRDRDENFFLWDLDGGRGVRRFSGHDIGFTAGGAFRWTTGADGIARFWAAESGRSPPRWRSSRAVTIGPWPRRTAI
jgi:WD40 repeat protein